MPPRVLSIKALNRALLARQMLLARTSLRIPQAVERMGCLQMQYAPSGYIGLWSRLRDFRREALTAALQRRTVIQATLLRTTIHLASPRDYVLLTAAIRRSRREWWQQAARLHTADLDMDAVAAAVRALLADGPRKHRDIVAALAAEGFPRLAWQGAGMWIDLLRVPPSGTWERRRADLYGLADHWLDPTAADERQGLEHLIRRYLGAFGPAAVEDIANWGGVPATTLRPVVESLDLRRFLDERSRDLVDLKRAVLPDPDTPAPVRFLPTWDAMLLVHARRAGILPEEYRPKIFSTKNPQSFPTVLIDGAVAGTWRERNGAVVIDYFAPVPAAVRREVEAEAAALAAFLS